MEREKYSPSKNYRDIREKHSPSKNYRDIGEVVTLMDKINAARELSSFCLGTEALLASNKNFDSYIRQNKSRSKPEKKYKFSADANISVAEKCQKQKLKNRS